MDVGTAKGLGANGTGLMECLGVIDVCVVESPLGAIDTGVVEVLGVMDTGEVKGS